MFSVSVHTHKDHHPAHHPDGVVAKYTINVAQLVFPAASVTIS